MTTHRIVDCGSRIEDMVNVCLFCALREGVKRERGTTVLSAERVRTAAASMRRGRREYLSPYEEVRDAGVVQDPVDGTQVTYAFRLAPPFRQLLETARVNLAVYHSGALYCCFELMPGWPTVGLNLVGGDHWVLLEAADEAAEHALRSDWLARHRGILERTTRAEAAAAKAQRRADRELARRLQAEMEDAVERLAALRFEADRQLAAALAQDA